ncbi:CRISPR-associated protein Cas2 [Parvularcula marina]|uniref:CRISPR-associated protein Cas2 n=1 Tax=Parvularcula marina TaxID=2292771 RepID=UPI0035161236
MALFAITYDLVERKDYQSLWDEFDRLGGHKALNSFYLISLNNNRQEVVDHFAEYIDEDDRLMVIEFNQKPKFTKALKGTNAWIDRHFQ